MFSRVQLFAGILHGLQDARLHFPSPSPWACSNSCPLSWWYHPAMSSSVIPFFSCPQSFPASESFSVSQLFVSGSQSIGASASASVLPRNTQGWFLLGLTGLISFDLQGTLRSFLQHYSSKATVLQHSTFFMVQLSHPYITTRKTTAFTVRTFVSKVMSLLFNKLSKREDRDSAQSCLPLCNPTDCSLPGSCYRLLQARILEWVAISFSRGSSWPRDRSRISRIAGRFFTILVTREIQNTY